MNNNYVLEANTLLIGLSINMSQSTVIESSNSET